MNYIIRELEINDYKKGYIRLLSQLTSADDMGFSNYIKIYTNYLFNMNEMIYVIEDNNEIIACGKILIENKFHNMGRNMGHIEDVVVDNNYRKLGLGKLMIDKLKEYGFTENCYKITLNCSDTNVIFYEKCGFSKKSNEMVIYNT